jgi:hypothetical protein
MLRFIARRKLHSGQCELQVAGNSCCVYSRYSYMWLGTAVVCTAGTVTCAWEQLLFVQQVQLVRSAENIQEKSETICEGLRCKAVVC